MRITIDRPADAQQFRPALAKALLRLGQARQAEDDVAGAAADWKRAVALIDAVAAPTGELVFINAACHASISSLAGPADTSVSPGDERRRDRRGYGPVCARRPAWAIATRRRIAPKSALDSLRGRDDFRLLMMDLAMPADPLAHER